MTYSDANVDTLTAASEDLIASMASALKIDSSLVSVSFTKKADGSVVVYFVIPEEFDETVNKAGFENTFNDALQASGNSVLETLSGTSGGIGQSTSSNVC